MNKMGIAICFIISVIPTVSEAVRPPRGCIAPQIQSDLPVIAIPKQLRSAKLEKCLMTNVAAATDSLPTIKTVETASDARLELEHLVSNVTLLDKKDDGDKVRVRVLGSAIWPQDSEVISEFEASNPMLTDLQWKELAHITYSATAISFRGAEELRSFMEGLVPMALVGATDDQHFVVYQFDC